MATNAELYRRGIVLPLDETAELALRCNHVTDQTKVHCLDFASEALFHELWKLGLFHAINQRCNCTLDDYEEGFVEPTALDEIVDAVCATTTNGRPSPDATQFLEKLVDLVRTALSLRRPLLFVL